MGKLGYKKPNCLTLMSDRVFEKKLLSIKLHDSQDPPLVTFRDKRSFYEKIQEKNKSDLNPGFYEENFHVTSLKIFKDTEKLL